MRKHQEKGSPSAPENGCGGTVCMDELWEKDTILRAAN